METLIELRSRYLQQSITKEITTTENQWSNEYVDWLEQQVKNLNIPCVSKSVCEHDIRNFKDRQECEKCGEVWIRQ